MRIKSPLETPSKTNRASEAGNRRWVSRLLWFAGLWLAGVATVTLLSYGIRAMIMP